MESQPTPAPTPAAARGEQPMVIVRLQQTLNPARFSPNPDFDQAFDTGQVVWDNDMVVPS